MALPWYLLLLVASAGAAQCPDGTTCGEKTLCCELPGGAGYGCCPEEEVASPSMPMITSAHCTDRTDCPEEYSCVATPQGGSACCPLAQGTSCPDGHHCCPSGSQCSDDGHHCMPASNASAVTCPDGRSECPNDATCCQMVDETWACCPMTEAVCCSDRLHCCPHSTQCDLQEGRCVSQHGSVPLSKKVPARAKLMHAEKVLHRPVCPDGSSCPDSSTCCLQTDQTYGCCPHVSAVCCNDHVHCCPTGTTCDVAHQKCVSQNYEIPMYTKLPALREEATVKCDDTTACPGTATCCRLATGEWGCCPYEKAVCCADRVHCCPNGFTCSAGGCQQAQTFIPWLRKVPALKQEATVKCDDTAACPGTATCCRLPTGEWGCCPYEKAVCCPDKVHCCPNGSTCAAGGCEQEQDTIPWLEKTPALKQDATVKCDDTTACPGTATCCRLPTGEWGCCPYEKAVCCADRVHCCPNGFTCSAGGCQQEQISIPWLEKTPALKHDATVKCDDTTACPGTATCCRLATGEWGCCPYEKAVCCPDKVHCCPNGCTCSAGGCQQEQISVPWLKKVPALLQRVTKVVCDDGHYCADDNTCCLLPSGQWGCCPHQKAVCCSDHLHCCPSGYVCDLSAGSCNKPAEDSEVSQPASTLQPLSYVWCDSTHACYDGQSCCVGVGGIWTCCPYPQGVCCPDRIHCCPFGHVCLNYGAQCSRSGGPRWDLGRKMNSLL